MIYQTFNRYFGLGMATLLISAGSIAQASPQSTSSREHSALATSHLHLGTQDARVASSRDDNDDKDEHGKNDQDDDHKKPSSKNS
ncbi:hypothetical protein [Synechocystis sp. LKSZ1]|uniref:hypothetical protein n=1 Tax=Synechocystis sp. LKSZ1 TaxID=3144951 RepID=UPI00336C2AE9